MSTASQTEDVLVLGTVEKDKDHVLKYTIKKIMNLGNGRSTEYLDIRLYFRNGKGHLLPTEKGLALTKARIPMTIQFLQQAEAYFNGKVPF